MSCLTNGIAMPLSDYLINAVSDLIHDGLPLPNTEIRIPGLLYYIDRKFTFEFNLH
jgi:hypothetical protein